MTHGSGERRVIAPSNLDSVNFYRPFVMINGREFRAHQASPHTFPPVYEVGCPAGICQVIRDSRGQICRYVHVLDVNQELLDLNVARKARINKRRKAIINLVLAFLSQKEGGELS